MALAMLPALAAFLVRPPPILLVQPPPAQPPSVALAVERIIRADASRCLDECFAESNCLEERVAKASAWLASRELIIKWGALKWLERNVLPHVPPAALPHLPVALLPQEPLTLRTALAPVEPGRLVRAAIARSPPRRAISLLWQWLLFSMSRLRANNSRRSRPLAPAMMELAAALERLS